MPYRHSRHFKADSLDFLYRWDLVSAIKRLFLSGGNETAAYVHFALEQLSSLSSGARLLLAFSASEMIRESRLL